MRGCEPVGFAASFEKVAILNLEFRLRVVGTGVPSVELAVRRIAAGDLLMKTFIDMLMKE